MLRWTISFAMAIIGLAFQSAAQAESEGEPNALYVPLNAGGGAASEVVDIVFVIDGSGSIDAGGSTSAFKLQLEGIQNCLIGPSAFIPHDGSVAVGVIQFGKEPAVEIHLTVIDDDGPDGVSAAGFNLLVQAIGFQSAGATVLSDGLDDAIGVLRDEGSGSERVIVVSTDAGLDWDDSLQIAREIKTGTGRAAGLASRICSVLIQNPCPRSANDQAMLQMKRLANSPDADPFMPDEAIGHYTCAEDLSHPPDGSALADFVILCRECSCVILHPLTDTNDCNENSIPDECEPACGITGQPPMACQNPEGDMDGDTIANQYDNCPCTPNSAQEDCDLDGVGDACETDPDCNQNHIPDNCEIAQGLAQDCNHDSIPDDCQLNETNDCNSNGVLDECDLDFDEDGEVDECGCLRYVDLNAPGQDHDGRTWQTAFLNLRDALQQVDPNDDCVIYVADGTYTPAGPNEDRGSSFEMTRWVRIFGGFAGYGAPDPNARNPRVYVTVLSGDLNGNDDGSAASRAENCYHVVDGSKAEAQYSLLDGFTITGGNANVDTASNNRGGGLYVGTVAAYPYSGSPGINGCLFTKNYATRGGAVVIEGTASTPHFVNCVFTENTAVFGGAIAAQGGPARFTNCTVTANAASNAYGGMRVLSSGNPIVTNCIFWGNTAGTGATTIRDAQIWSGSVPITVTYSIVQDDDANDQDVFVGVGNLDDDPLFASPTYLMVRPHSPAIDAGDNAVIPNLVYGAQGINRVDFGWNKRVLDDPATTDTGSGTAPIVDIGAY